MVISGILFFAAASFFAGTSAGPLHGHTHPKVIYDETWNITAVIYSGRDDNPNWVITQDDRKNSNVSVIAKAIDWYTHNDASGKQLSSQNGYKGFMIMHILNGKNSGTNYLPACSYPNLEKALMDHTAPMTMKANHKDLILCTIGNCKKTTKQDCFQQPTIP